MNEWVSRVSNHRVWKVMEDLGPKIDAAEKVEGIEPASLVALERLRAVLALCGKRLGGADPVTVLPAPLESIAANLTTAKDEIEAFVSDKNVDRLTAANAGADHALLALAQVVTVSTKQELVDMVRVANESRKVFEQHSHHSLESLKKAESEIAELRKQLETFSNGMTTTAADLQKQIDTERQKIANQFSEQQKTFGDSQESRNNVFSEVLRKNQESLNQTITEHQRQFSDAQENRIKEFSTTQTEAQKRFNDTIGDYTKRLGDQDADFTRQREAAIVEYKGRLLSLDTDFQQKASVILDEVNRHKGDVEKLVGVIGTLGVTAGYQKNADTARNSMYVWQSVAVGALIAVILFAYFAFLPTMKGDFHWSSFATRVFLTITVGVLAAYAVSQADRFYKMESKNRRLALELAAIDPFIALLPEDKQFEFKLEIGRKTFAQEESQAEPKTDKSPATALDMLASKESQSLMQWFLDLVKTIKK